MPPAEAAPDTRGTGCCLESHPAQWLLCTLVALGQTIAPGPVLVGPYHISVSAPWEPCLAVSLHSFICYDVLIHDTSGACAGASPGCRDVCTLIHMHTHKHVYSHVYTHINKHVHITHTHTQPTRDRIIESLCGIIEWNSHGEHKRLRRACPAFFQIGCSSSYPQQQNVSIPSRVSEKCYIFPNTWYHKTF